jgi:hypothetical protein
MKKCFDSEIKSTAVQHFLLIASVAQLAAFESAGRV